VAWIFSRMAFSHQGFPSKTLRQIYKIIGSVEFVGNPTMLLTSVFSGMKDFVTAPSTAFLRSPTDPSRLGLGVAKGTLSLFSHSASGFFGFLSKVSASAGQVVAVLSLDPEYRIWHRDQIVTEASNLNRDWKRRGLQSAGAIITRPLGDIILGITAGVFGVVISPVKEYKRGGQQWLLRGLAMGGAGVLTKPLVGLFDAMAHFAASIHDIAKSVNVLEKRYQLAIKYRLPYTFGICNIMIPFDTNTARAAYLLKLYPIKKSRRPSLPSGGEVLVHVEVLPNFGIDTFVIITSQRLIVIRVKKEASGTLTPSLCWQVIHAGESVVSSRVSDHGHNGVAFTITLMKRPEEGTNAPHSPTDDKKVVIQEGEEMNELDELESPEEGLQFEQAAEEFEHGTGRGKEGELLEWFTILAEYQYRRQLSRIHNALSCLVGDFDAVMKDPSLGRPGSTEGYSSFGIFYFEAERSEEVTDKRKVWQALERQPQTSESIAAAHENEQIQYPGRLASALGGETPELATGMPLLEDTLVDDWMDSSSDHRQDLVRQPTSGTNYFSALTREECNSERAIPSGLRAYSFHSASEGIDREVGDDTRADPGFVSPLHRKQTGSFSSADASTTEALPPMLEPPVSTESQPSAMPPPAATTKDAQTQAAVEGGLRSTETTTSQPDAQPTSFGQERLDRMESLMERLLIFTTERTLEQERAREGIGTPSTDSRRPDESLRRDMAELSTELNRQTRQEEASYEEIVGLRREIAELREQIAAGFMPQPDPTEGFESASSQGSAPNEWPIEDID